MIVPPRPRCRRAVIVAAAASLAAARLAAASLVAARLEAGAGSPAASEPSAAPAAAAAAAAAPATPTPPAPHAAFERVAPLAGTWRARGERLVEVVWTPAAGRNMTGLYRALGPDGGASTLELLALAPTGDGGLELRFRHFGADVQPWGSERDGPLVLRAAPVAPDDPGARRVRFVAVAPGAAVPAIVYDLRAPDRLHVAVTLAGEADPTFTVEFDRVGPPPDAGAAAPAAAAPRR